LTSVLHGVSGQLHAPAALPPEERVLSSHRIGGWTLWRREISSLCRELNPNSSAVQLVARRYTD
jgi:hypothetical protein